MPATPLATVDSERRLLATCRALTAGRAPAASFAGQDAVALRRTVAAHGLSGLATRAIEDYTLMVPRAVADGVRADWRAAREWCSALDQECERIGQAAMAEADARSLYAPLLLKGRSVAHHYGDPTLRTYVDFDLLVPTDQFDAWASFLANHGYHGPSSELAPTRRRHQSGVTLGRPSPKGTLVCDLHSCLFVERTARDVTYEELCVDALPSPFTGLCEASPAAQLLILALHFCQHPAWDRRLIWARDLIELGHPESVADARGLAAAHGVGWVVESALSRTEDVLGYPRWNARPAEDPGGARAQVNRLEQPGYLYHVALVRELGVVAGARYFLSRIDPRRFARPDGSIEWRAAASWVGVASRRLADTPWRSWRRSVAPSARSNRVGRS